MLKGILIFFVSISILLLLLAYFMGEYHLNTDYIIGRVTRQTEGERVLVFDRGAKEKDSYSLKVTTSGRVEFQKNDRGERDYRNFKITPEDIKKISAEMDSTGVFKIVSLDRNYCFTRYVSDISFDFGWINKNVKYSNCVDDPIEVKNFRKFLYDFFGLTLFGT